jgi:cytochrome c
MDLPFRIRRRAAWTVAVTMLIALIRLGAARHVHAAAQAPSTVLDGVYSEAQAKRGEKLYGDACGNCHGATLTGTTVAPPLVGGDFLANFGGMSVGDLFSKLLKTMPSDDPGTLTPPQAADALAFIFSQNKWPAGPKDLTTDVAALKQIRILTK